MNAQELSARQQRGAKNQSLFREVNERIEELRASNDKIEFVCECDKLGCEEMVSLTLNEYEELRQVSTHFVVRPGHRADEIEQVVRRCDGYEVVEKVGAAGAVAVELDSRS